MDKYITGAAIKRLREARGLTQAQLADILSVSDKAVSKWETCRSYPDITLMEPLAAALGISVIELLSGEAVTNKNRASNMTRMKFYVCPICGNVITATGEATVSCCGITLPALEDEAPDGQHEVTVTEVEDEYYVTLKHPMTKSHYISFMAALSDDGIQLIKLYPEGEAAARFKCRRTRLLYLCCNKHGLFKVRL